MTKIKKRIFALIIALSFVMLFTLTIENTWANSAETYFFGVDSAGVVVTEKESPVIVESEKLVFDIDKFPDVYIYESNNGGKVTATYNFYNPSSLTITSTLLFPFGTPYYNDYRDNTIDIEKNYSITKNGQPVERKIRHVVYDESGNDGDNFSVEKAFVSYSDEKIQGDFFNENTKVTLYDISVNDVNDKENSTCLAFDIDSDMKNRKIYFPEMDAVHRISKNKHRLGCFLKGGGLFSVYVFGEPFETFPQIKFYKDASFKREINGNAVVEKKSTVKFDDLIMKGFSKDYGVSELDWYNAVISKMIVEGKDEAFLWMNYIHSNELLRNLTTCFEYKLTFNPGERAVNEVIAPLYPDIDTNFNPTICIYNYLLSPAKTWKEFGKVDIEINTPYYLVSSTKGYNFEKTERGYKAKLDSLLKEDLSFTLSESEKPENKSRGCGCR